MYELKSITSHTEEYDGNSTTESRTMDIEEGNIGKKEFNYGKKNKIKSYGFFTDNESSFLGTGKMAPDKDNQKNAKNNVKITDILNCPWEFHTNFVSSIFFLIGAAFFIIAIDFGKIKSVDYKVFIVYVSNLIGGLLFTIASILFFYPTWYNSACYMYVTGSSLFTLATWFDYINYVTGVA
ncbi:Uncharacterized protein PCOAH_00007600 [Plasmodium coatneyi]|uniref:YrhK domain-containing protein n=1 Tax=Plasmodium coatneyi TaxID=208452 RepID=A0A1B1DUA2_9APIC|nr:Uncharacterized protein PCOAH_00007600 [Plasmodium coatneyi]ANQ06358.1 Uncharacterized protein PCOAH_00007600 [Plasmodium coatneyi]